MSLETSRLGQSELIITRVGIGTAPIGSNPTWSIYWGRHSESEAIRASVSRVPIYATPPSCTASFRRSSLRGPKPGSLRIRC